MLQHVALLLLQLVCPSLGNVLCLIAGQPMTAPAQHTHPSESCIGAAKHLRQDPVAPECLQRCQSLLQVRLSRAAPSFSIVACLDSGEYITELALVGVFSLSLVHTFHHY